MGLGKHTYYLERFRVDEILEKGNKTNSNVPSEQPSLAMKKNREKRIRERGITMTYTCVTLRVSVLKQIKISGKVGMGRKEQDMPRSYQVA